MTLDSRSDVVISPTSIIGMWCAIAVVFVIGLHLKHDGAIDWIAVAIAGSVAVAIFVRDVRRAARS